jgi:hypothetical protein
MIAKTDKIRVVVKRLKNVKQKRQRKSEGKGEGSK